MSRTNSLEELERAYQEKREQRERAEREEQFLKQQVTQAKLRRSLSTHAPSFAPSRVTKHSASRRQSGGTSMPRNAQHAPLSTSMNRSFTVQPATTASPVDGLCMPSMPMIQELGGMATGMIDRLGDDEPANVVLLQRATSQYPTPDCGTNPMDFISNLPSEDEYVSASPDFFSSYPHPESPSTPSLSGGESTSTRMSREPSTMSSSYLMAQELAHSESDLSPSLEQWSSHEVYGISNPQQSLTTGKNPCDGGDVFFGMGGSFALAAVPMSRTISTTSSKSSGSKQGERAKEAHERHILNSLRNQIAPKPSDNAEKPESSITSSKKEGRVPLTKSSTYQRPPKKRVFCSKCKEHPLGFRGQHELSRHEAAKHADVVTRWRVRDPRPLGIPTRLELPVPIEKCKACQTGKLYGAYYNVAAHLRRAHCKEKVRKQRKNAVQLDAEKAPKNEVPMSELKHWMVEVKVRKGEIGFDVHEDNLDEGTEYDCSLDMVVMPELVVTPDSGSSLSSASPYEMPLEMVMGQMPDLAFTLADYGGLPDGFAVDVAVAT